MRPYEIIAACKHPRPVPRNQAELEALQSVAIPTAEEKRGPTFGGVVCGNCAAEAVRVASVQASPEPLCGGCVSCACRGRLRIDEDGLCASCGGVPLAVVLTFVGVTPHPCPTLDAEDHLRIERRIRARARRVSR